MNAGDVNNCRLYARLAAIDNKKPDRTFVQPGSFARSGEEKASHEPAPVPTVEPARKFHEKPIVTEKISSGMAAMQLLHCTIFNKSPIPWSREDQQGLLSHGVLH
ncbi:hypothetical protein LB572_15110 [Mesorhizobium sp. BH1-1-5]|uniref:hypothetical protein n=1 Tax=unclassified Mesorhizobium TaxID=325217 RepID=UPI001129F9CD|nr:MULTISPECIES: hypothetical protein [unclassified Mesorhizobium]MBZ9988426.1 hypothetical protein [Mesorhizobium sp. BH1-1-5]TPJ58797.1 hypothetical protein FJ471_20275 [Mesorhizobium sp. B2-7-1]